jgi:hypothetical protein
MLAKLFLFMAHFMDVGSLAKEFLDVNPGEGLAMIQFQC